MCDHRWKIIHDWMGDPSVVYGTILFEYACCAKCGEEVRLDEIDVNDIEDEPEPYDDRDNLS